MPAERSTVAGHGGSPLAVVDFGGSGPGLLLLQGMMGRATTWESTARWLIPQGHVVGFDARGHGLNETLPQGPYDRNAHVEDAAAVIRTLGLAPAVASDTRWAL
ncbi:alpha/beta fold hydrolase [Streptomyces atroolivaceus]|uniref:alpha/beta fold hydrolase n=1 Tax=Streptomyces atroolivaceus TaxID=66869 RepID=UPI0037882B9F